MNVFPVVLQGAWKLLRAIPREVWAVVVACAMVWLVLWSIKGYGADRYEAGRREVQDRAAHLLRDTLAWEQARHARELAAVRQRTDTLVLRVRGRTDTLWQTISSLSPDIKQHPQVQALVRQCTALAQDCEKMRDSFHAERVRSDSLRVVLDTRLDAQAVVLAAKADTIRTLAARPTKRRAWLTAAAALLVGVVAGGAR